MMNKNGRCVHFNGMANESCLAGVNYDSMRAEHEPIGTRTVSFPCIATFNAAGVVCPQFRSPTQEEIDADEADHQRTMDLMAKGLSSCCEATIDKSRVILSGRHKGHGPRFCSKCKRCVFMV